MRGLSHTWGAYMTYMEAVMSRPVVIIGDIHGRSDLLSKLIASIRDRFGTEVDIYNTGDVIDRGHDAKGAVQLCIDEGIKGIIGNHEIWLHKYLTTGFFDNFALHTLIQGKPTLQSYGLEADPMSGWSTQHIEQNLHKLIPSSHRNYILGLPVWRRIVIGNEVLRLTHASIKKSTAATLLKEADQEFNSVGDLMGDDIDDWTADDYLVDTICKKDPSQVLWTSNSFRNPAFYYFKDGGIQVFGHSPTPRGVPIITKHWVAVDTGAGVRRSVLSAVAFPSREVFSVNELTGNLDEEGYADFTM